MTTLREQLTVGGWAVDHVATRADIVHETMLSARVGRSGSDRHAVYATVWEARPETPANPPYHGVLPPRPRSVSAGSVHCGSRRGGSGVHSFSFTAPVTCERCLGRAGRFSVESLPDDVITQDRLGRLIPREAL